MAAQLGHARLHSHHPRQGRSAEQTNQGGINPGNLLLQPRATGSQFRRTGLAVVRGTALHHVAHIDIPAAIKAGFSQELVKQLAGTAHKGFSNPIFGGTRGFPDQHQTGLLVAPTDHHLLAPGAEAAAGAGFTGRGKSRPIGRRILRWRLGHGGGSVAWGFEIEFEVEFGVAIWCRDERRRVGACGKVIA